MKRSVEVVIISDLHLGMNGIHADELLQYLKSIKPSILVLNGDVFDIWNYRKFNKTQIAIIRQLLKFVYSGVKTYYITGNHDDALRKFSGFKSGNFTLDDKLILNVGGKKVWIFHGDVFDSSTMGGAKFFAKLGGKGYDILIGFNRFINNVLHFFGYQRVSFSKKVKASVKKAVKFIKDFEQLSAELAIDQGFDIVVCGHIHQPQKRIINTEKGSILYLNSGDWVENTTALEYNDGEWIIYTHPIANQFEIVDDEEGVEEEPSLYESIVNFKSLYESALFSASDRKRPYIPSESNSSVPERIR